MTQREEFLSIFRQHVARPGADRLLDWLDHKTDFFTCPASTRFHGACEGGLCMHSLNVYHALHDNFFKEGDSEESFAICALLHDLCKANYYKVSTRNVKNDATGQWEKVPYYTVEDQFPYGHGEKSVFLIERFMRLKTEEAVAIRWHMGGFDDAARGGSFAISEAYDRYPLAIKLHIADLTATYLMEHRTSAVRCPTQKGPCLCEAGAFLYAFLGRGQGWALPFKRADWPRGMFSFCIRVSSWPSTSLVISSRGPARRRAGLRGPGWSSSSMGASSQAGVSGVSGGGKGSPAACGAGAASGGGEGGSGSSNTEGTPGSGAGPSPSGQKGPRASSSAGAKPSSRALAHRADSSAFSFFRARMARSQANSLVSYWRSSCWAAARRRFSASSGVSPGRGPSAGGA